MPALTTLVVTDRQATPVNYTLSPDGEKDGVYFVAVADASGVAISKKRLGISRRETADRIKVTEKWRFPTIVTETINGVSSPTVARVAYIDVTFTFEKTHTEQERKDVVGMFYSAHAVGKVLTEDVLVKDQNIW